MSYHYGKPSAGDEEDPNFSHLTSKGKKIKGEMEKEYGKEKGKRVFYASRNKGTIKGIDKKSMGSAIIHKMHQ